MSPNCTLLCYLIPKMIPLSLNPHFTAFRSITRISLYFHPSLTNHTKVDEILLRVILLKSHKIRFNFH